MGSARRLFSTAMFVVLVVVAYQACRHALRPEGYDLTAYIHAGAAAVSGVSPYGMDVTFPYLYSPCFACLMVPWAWLPTLLASLLWYALSVAALVWLAQKVRGWLPAAHGHAAPLLAALVLSVGMFRLVQSNLVNGQVNLILVAMCVASFEAERAGRPRLAGFWLALAVHTKALPILLLGYLLVRRRWAAVAWTAVFGVALALLPLLFWAGDTWSIYMDYLEQLRAKIHSDTIADGAITIASRGDREYFTLRGLLATIAPATASMVVVKYGCLVAVVVGALVLDLWHRRRPGLASHAAAFSTWLAAALLISPISEKHHLALMFPAVGLGALRAARNADDLLAWMLVGGAGICMWLAKPWPSGPWYLLVIVIGLAAAWRATAPEVAARRTAIA